MIHMSIHRCHETQLLEMESWPEVFIIRAVAYLHADCCAFRVLLLQIQMWRLLHAYIWHAVLLSLDITSEAYKNSYPM